MESVALVFYLYAILYAVALRINSHLRLKNGQLDDWYKIQAGIIGLVCVVAFVMMVLAVPSLSAFFRAAGLSVGAALILFARPKLGKH